MSFLKEFYQSLKRVRGDHFSWMRDGVNYDVGSLAGRDEGCASHRAILTDTFRNIYKREKKKKKKRKYVSPFKETTFLRSRKAKYLNHDYFEYKRALKYYISIKGIIFKKKYIIYVS